MLKFKLKIYKNFNFGCYMKKNKTSFLFFITLLLSINIFCQSKNNNEIEYFKWFDNIIDARNNHLSNGVSYSEKHRTKKGHHEYYQTSDFLIGDIIYDNQLFFDVDLKYNLFSDEIILGLYNGDNLKLIQLIKDKIDKFWVNNIAFAKISDQRNKINGYYEILLESNNLNFYKKHIKERIRHLDKDFVYYSFKKKINYLIYYQNSYHKINSKKSVLKLFPKKKKVINNFFSVNSNLNKENTDLFMKLLFQQILKNNKIE